MIRQAKTQKDKSSCFEVARSLSDWFDEHDLVDVRKSIDENDCYIYEIDTKVVGFMCVQPKFESTLEILYCGVAPEMRNKGIGSELLDFIEKNPGSGKIIEVKTLDASREYEPYRQTRAFFESHGFKQIERIESYTGWSENSPCAIYVKVPTLPAA